MIKFLKESDEVLYPREDFVCVSNKDLLELKKLSINRITRSSVYEKRRDRQYQGCQRYY